MKKLITKWGKRWFGASLKNTARPLWLVHFGEGICEKMPEKFQICVYAEDWQPGYIYVPLGSILVASNSAKEARNQAMDVLLIRSLEDERLWDKMEMKEVN